MELSEGRIPIGEDEDRAVTDLRKANEGSMSLTREGETLIVHIGDQTWKVEANGRKTKVT